MAERKLITEQLTYPSGSMMKYVYKSPILLYRLGLGPLIGRLFMIMTTTGRKSGLPRRTAIEYHQHKGRKYVMVGWEKSDWYRNIQANPLLTIQTATGTQSVRARQLKTDSELSEAWEVAENSPIIKGVMRLTGADLTREAFLAQKDRFILLTFDPTDEPTPPPLKDDLRWVLPTIANIVIPMLIRRWIRSRKRQ